MENAVQEIVAKQVLTVAKAVEDKLDEEIQALDRLDLDDLEVLRERRLQQMKKMAEKRNRWISLGHGDYSEIHAEKDFFSVVKASERVVCHFYRDNWPCKVMDKHLSILAKQHIETRFVKINAEKSPYLAEKLRIVVLPTLALVKNAKVDDYLVGFDELGGTDEFSTEELEERLAKTEVIVFEGESSRILSKSKAQSKKSVRQTSNPDSSDSELMEDTNQQSIDPFTSVSSSGERVVEPNNAAEQPISPKDERIGSANASPDAAIPGASRNAQDLPVTSETGALPTFYPLNSYSPQDQGLYYGGYDNGTGSWVEQSNDVNVNNLHVVPPGMYNENPLFFPPGYGFDPQMAFGQFSPIASPLSPFMIDGQLYSHQIPVSPPYYAPPVSPGLPHVTSALPASQPDLVAPGSTGHEIDGTHFGPGSGYYIPVGPFGGGELSGSSNMGFYNYQGEAGSGQSLPNRANPVNSGRYMSQMTSAGMYPQPAGILGSYEQNAMQASHQGLGFTPGSSSRQYSQGGLYPSANYGSGSSSLWESGHRNCPDRAGRRERDRHSINISSESLGMASERNRGPRALKPKSKAPIEDSSSSVNRTEVELTSVLQADQYNRPEFVTDYEHAKFFVIKSFSEDNVHKSIKYSVWASTPQGNRKLDAAYGDAKKMNANCPVFLFFSVNASGQFCGVAEMAGPVDFENNAEYWQQDRWSGQFPVKWHVIKDVPNSQFRHILLEHNDNKPVTHSRDSQEVKLPEGLEMLKIFKNYEADTSILDDFTFYDEREKSLLEKKSKQRPLPPGSAAVAVTTAADTISQLADSLAGTLNLEGNKKLP